MNRMDARFTRDYPNTTNAVLAARYGVSLATVARWARRAMLSKSKAHIADVQRARSLGRVLSSETREQIGLAALGRKLSAETKAKIALSKQMNDSVPRGQRHYKWKGGRPWARFKDPRYVDWRRAVLSRDAFTCRSCGRRCRQYERGLAAHHVMPFALHPDMRYEVANGLTLCRSCHMKVHGKKAPAMSVGPCACGCGTDIALLDVYGRRRRFVNGHGRRKPPPT